MTGDEAIGTLRSLLFTLWEDEILSEQQCAAYMDVDLVTWRACADNERLLREQFGLTSRDSISPHAWAQAAAERLVQQCAEEGLVLTVDQVSQPPLAMGNYTTTVAVRPARGIRS